MGEQYYRKKQKFLFIRQTMDSKKIYSIPVYPYSIQYLASSTFIKHPLTHLLI
jgi:hypothetical protein